MRAKHGATERTTNMVLKSEDTADIGPPFGLLYKLGSDPSKPSTGVWTNGNDIAETIELGFYDIAHMYFRKGDWYS